MWTRDAFPFEHLRTGHSLGQVFLRRGDWHSASVAYESAREAFLLMFGQGLDETDARHLIENAGPLFAEAAYAASEMGDPEAAFSLLNEGKAQLMAVALGAAGPADASNIRNGIASGEEFAIGWRNMNRLVSARKLPRESRDASLALGSVTFQANGPPGRAPFVTLRAPTLVDGAGAALNVTTSGSVVMIRR